MHYKIKLLPPDFCPEVQKLFNREVVSTCSDPEIALQKFQASLKKYLPQHSLLGLNSGTAALHLGLQLLGVKRGDQVLCPTFTFAATVNAILYLQANPVFIDSEEQSWNMDPALLELAITEGLKKGKRPAAILLVHSYGTPAQIDAILKVSQTYKIPILEDAAPAFGAYFQGQMVGTFGEFGAFSFNYNKILTTAGGGLLIGRDEASISQANHLANQARKQAPFYLHDTMGYNYRMSGLAASLGFVQLSFLSQKLDRKKQLFTIYKRELQECAGIRFQDFPKETEPNYWLTSFLLNSKEAKEKAFNTLQSAGIECRMLWNPMHLQPAFRKYTSFLSGVAEDLFNRGLSLPSAVSLTDSEQEEVINQVKISL